MKVSVHYYAAAKDLTGCESSTFEFAPESIPQAEIRSAIVDRFPSLAAFLERMPAARPSFCAESPTRKSHSTKSEKQSSTPERAEFASFMGLSATMPTGSGSRGSTTKLMKASRKKK
jgi:hypothetical protein